MATGWPLPSANRPRCPALGFAMAALFAETYDVMEYSTLWSSDHSLKVSNCSLFS
jgi:hypothetical protein